MVLERTFPVMRTNFFVKLPLMAVLACVPIANKHLGLIFVDFSGLTPRSSSNPTLSTVELLAIIADRDAEIKQLKNELLQVVFFIFLNGSHLSSHSSYIEIYLKCCRTSYIRIYFLLYKFL